MAKKAGKAGPKGGGQGESIQGYFKRLLRENPAWLEGRSNAALLGRWLEDHPDQAEVSDSVKAGLQNAKSALRSKKRRRKAQQVAGAQPALAPAGRPVGHGRRGRSPQGLEEQIDDCLNSARALDREGLANVISLLRRARNELVWKMGQ
jgi:hypothetical protein